MFRTVLLAAVVPLALGSEYSYTYDYTDAPTAAPTTETMAPTRSDTYAPTRMTEAPSYAPRHAAIFFLLLLACDEVFMQWASLRRYLPGARLPGLPRQDPR